MYMYITYIVIVMLTYRIHKFPVFWEHGLYPWNWEFQQCFIKNWEKIHDCNFAMINKLKESLSRMISSII